jgi:Contractile injection system tube protein
MERVAFLLETTGERIGCLLNPENLVVSRTAGVRPRRSAGGTLTGAGMADDPLLYTGGGRTELELKLLFDVGLAGSSIVVADVRELTAPLWRLAENDAGQEVHGRPPLVRFVWGKSWNVPGVVAAVAERLEQFTPEGVPTRSWLRMKFLRAAEPSGATAPRPPQPAETALELAAAVEPAPAAPGPAAPPTEQSPEGQARVHQVAAGERLDQIAQRYYGYYGHPALWRWLAVYNGIADPLHIAPGFLLQIPPLSILEGRR